ncbi:hypothetical protein NHG25_07790 [Aerococcaceae bacterium NML191292]|nr:hypothetical protein [Aerococcaceae bacterium NML191292]
MKRWCIVVMCLALVGQWHTPLVCAQSQVESRVEQASEQTEQEHLMTQLQQLESMEQYEVQYVLSNIRNQQKMAQVTIVGDQRTGDAQLVFDFYYRNASPSHYRLELISYNHFSLVYARQFAFLQSMAFFKQPQFPASMHDEMNVYEDYYVALDSSHVTSGVKQEQWLSLLHLLPSKAKFNEIPAQQLHQVEDMHFLSLEKLAIPEYLFENQPFLALDYQLDLTFLRGKDDSRRWQIQSAPKLQVAKANANSQFKVRVHAELEQSPSQLTQLKEALLGTADFNRTMQLDGTDIANKLKKIQLFYNEATQAYRATLEGVTENVNWNLLGEGATTLKSYDFKVEYSVRPTTKQVPNLFDMKRMTQAEFSYVLAQYLEQKEQLNGNE